MKWYNFLVSCTVQKGDTAHVGGTLLPPLCSLWIPLVCNQPAYSVKLKETLQANPCLGMILEGIYMTEEGGGLSMNE